MKTKLMFAFLALFISITGLQAQDKKANDAEFKMQMHQLQDKYELQKRTIQQSFQSELRALQAQTGLTPEQRETQRKAYSAKIHAAKKS